MDAQEKNIEIKGSRLPLEPIVTSNDPDYAEIKVAYDALLAQCRRLEEIRLSQVDGASVRLDKEKRIYSVDEYNEMLADYTASRTTYIEKYKVKLETIEGVREKIRQIEEEEERFERENPIEDIPSEMPDFEEIPGESLESFSKRNDEYWKLLRVSIDNTMNQMDISRKRTAFLIRRLEEICKFEELECELEHRLRHMHINEVG